MAAYLPIPGGHITFAGRFVDPALSFAMGWMYCMSFIMLCARVVTELVA